MVDRQRQQADDDLSDIVVEVIPSDMELGHDADGLPKSLPKKADGTPDDRHVEKVDPREEARKAAEAELGKQWQQERQALIAQRDAERAARAEIERQAQERLAAERRAREEAEGQRDEHTTWAKNAHWQVLQERKEKFETGLKTMEAHVEELQNQIAAASEAGDHARVGALNRKMAEAANAKANFEAATARIDGEIEDVRRRFTASDHAREQQRQREQEQTSQKTDEPFDLDKWIADSPAVTQPWLKAHRGDLSDMKYLRRVFAFATSYAADHSDDPKALDSAEFVSALEAKFDNKEKAMATEEKKDKTDEVEEIEEAKPEQRTTHSAPVTRSSRPAQSSSAGGAIKLTQDQFNIAPGLYPTYDELSPEAKAKFPAWSETAARWQYHQDLQRAHRDKKFER